MRHRAAVVALLANVLTLPEDVVTDEQQEAALALSTEDLLGPVFESHTLNPATVAYPSAVSDGNVAVRALDNPKDLPAGPSIEPLLWPLELVVTVSPAADRPAQFTKQVDLNSNNYGPNRLHVFVHVHSAAQCSAAGNDTATSCGPYSAAADDIISARLAPVGAPDQVLRHVNLRAPNLALLPGEWHEVLGDFYLLPEEYGLGSNRMKLFVTLGAEYAKQGQVSMTDLTVTPLPLINVARSKRVALGSSISMISAGFFEPPDNVILTDGVTSGQPWYTIDQPPIDPVKFMFDLMGSYWVCSLRVEFIGSSSHVTDFELRLSPVGGPFTDISTGFTQVFQYSNFEWTNWRSRQLANPVSTAQRWFHCTRAQRARLQLTNTENSIFAFTEFELYGYDEERYGLCSQRCRHGGTCQHQAQGTCSCPRKWGWRGRDCNVDVNECELAPDSQIAKDRVPRILFANGGCGRGDPLKANCTNVEGSWNCDCVDGFDGTSSHGDGNSCTDIDECAGRVLPMGGCAATHGICLNTVGSYICQCKSGYVPAFDRTPSPSPVPSSSPSDSVDAASSWDNQGLPAAEVPPDPTRHLVTRQPLLGAICQPVCDQECVHGGTCISPNTCGPCDDGWRGKFCNEEECEVHRSYVREEDGVLVEELGCYHGGECLAKPYNCINCRRGWTGDACDVVPGGFVALGVGLLSACLVIPCTVAIVLRREWLPFQERGLTLILIQCFATLIIALTAPAAANPSLYGIGLVPDDSQPESWFWGLFFPYFGGYAIWTSCLLVRMRNLVTIHLQGNTPLTVFVQLAGACFPWLVASALPEQVALVLWLACLGVFMVYYVLLCLRLRTLRKDLDDLYANFLGGVIAAGVVGVLTVARLFTKRSYSNPDGLNLLFPVALIGTVTLHFFFNVTRLVVKMVRKDKDLMQRYNHDGSSDDDNDDGKSDWRKRLRGNKKKVVLKLNSGEGDIATAGDGIFGLFKRPDNAAMSSTEDDSSSEESTTDDESSSDSELEVEPEPELEVKVGRWAPTARMSRGRGNRWSRGGRAQGRGGRIQPTVPMNSNHEATSHKTVVGPIRKTYGDVRPLRTAAKLFTEIAEPVLDAPAEDSDDETTSSSDPDLEDLEAEVRRFEAQVAMKQSGAPGALDGKLDKDAKAQNTLSVEMELHRLIILEEEALRQSRLTVMKAGGDQW